MQSEMVLTYEGSCQGHKAGLPNAHQRPAGHEAPVACTQIQLVFAGLAQGCRKQTATRVPRPGTTSTQPLVAHWGCRFSEHLRARDGG